MSPLSNAEKQARHRKKEALKRLVDQVYRETEGLGWEHGANGHAMLTQLKQLAELPSGWTDEDFDHAVERVNQLRIDLVSPNNDLDNDVYDVLGTFDYDGRKTPMRTRRIESQKSIEDTRHLASHIISALELSGLSNGEKAAALCEALRFVGRPLANERPVRKSNANIVCLSVLPPNYRRPDWFAEAFAEWIAYRLGEEGAMKDLGNSILNFKSRI